MRILTSKYWEKEFTKTVTNKNGKKKIIRDGKRFEDLVQKILDLEYGSNHWKPTGNSWDGSRDFEWRTSHSCKWAECKNYEDKISLNVISNTLVMAIVDFADEILIFSYSKIKKPVLDKLMQYADVSQKKIKVYADESLEEIILLHFSELESEFFPSANFTKTDLECLAPYISCQIIADPVIAYTMNTDLGAIPKNPSEINFDTILCLNIFAYNRSSQKITVKTAINWVPGVFLVLNAGKKNTQNFAVAPSSIVVKKIYFRVLKYSPSIHFPDVTVTCGTYNNTFPFGAARCSWIGDCILQGSSYNEINNDFKVKVIQGRFFRAINLYGTSGVGKSRLLKECENIALGYGFRIIRFQTNLQSKEFSNAKNIITEFICGIYDIPNLEEVLTNSQGENLSGVYQILYNIANDLDSPYYIEKTVLPMVKQKLRKTRCYISIDNIQYYPTLFISFLSSVIENLLTENISCKSRIGISFNMDYISQQDACMSLWNLLYNNKNYIVAKEITGFATDGEIRLFLNQLLPNLDIDPEQTQILVEKSKGNPFYVKTYLSLLETENIIIKQEDGYIIPPTKQEIFIERMQSIPKNISGILEARWNYYLKNHGKTQSLQVLGVLHIFQKLDNELIQKFCLPNEIINDLCNSHFVVKQSEIEQTYTFEHDLMEMYLAKKYFPLCKYAFELKHLPMDIDHEWYNFLYIIIKRNKRKKLLNDLITKREPPYKIGYEIFMLCISQIINQITSVEMLEDNLQPMTKICETTREIYGTDAAINLYKGIVNMIKNRFDNYQTNINWAWIMISYCNLLYERNLYQNAIAEIKNLLNYWPKDKITDKNRIIYAYLYNRLHVYHRALHGCITMEVKNWLEKSEELQNCSDSPAEMIDEIKFINLIDRGYCSYDDVYSKDKVLTAWKQACEIYEKGRIIFKKVNYLFAKIQIALLQNDLSKAEAAIKEGVNAVDMKEQGTYYFLYFKQRYLLCQVVYLLLDNQYQPQEIKDLFTQIEDYNYILKSRISYSIQWLKSIYYFQQKEYKDAFMCIQSSYYILYESKKKTFQAIYLEQMCNNVRYFLARGIVDDNLSADTIKLTAEKLISPLRGTSQMSMRKLKQFISSCRATSILQDKEHKINFPTL